MTFRQALLLLWLVAPIWLRAQVVAYQSTDDNPQLGAHSPAFEFGDEVTLAGTGRSLQDIQFEYFGRLVEDPGKWILLAIYKNDGPSGSPGTAIYQSDPIAARAGFHSVIITGISGITLTDRVTVTLATTGLNPGESVAWLVAGPPSIGSSVNDFWQKNGQGLWERQTPGAGESPGNFSLKLLVASTPPPNVPPTISSVADQTTVAGAPSTVVTVTIDDPDHSNPFLFLSVTSTDPNLVPAQSTNVANATQTWSVLLNPNTNILGSATVTLSVNDGRDSASTSFLFTVIEPVIPEVTISVLPGAAEPDIAGYFVLSRTGALDHDLPVSFTLGGDATGGVDYTIPSSLVRIPTGQRAVNVAIKPIDDGLVEGPETVTLTLDSSPQYTSGPFPTASIIIKDDESINPAPPSILTQPQRVEAPAGDTAIFKVSAVGTSPLSYQWWRDSEVVTGATNDTLTISNVARGPISSVWVVVSNPYGTVQSDYADLLVPPFPQTNAIPTISPISTQSIEPELGETTLTVPFTIGDVETPAGQLMVFADSSDKTLLPDSGIRLGGESASRTVTLTLAPGKTGMVVITLTVVDGDGGTATASFILSTSTYEGPNFDTPPDQIIRQDQATVVPVVAYYTKVVPSLSLSGSSSNPSLVAADGLIFSGDGFQRTLTIHPVPGQTGPATITVTLHSDYGAISHAFQVTVLPPNQPPVISIITDQVIPEGSASLSVAFSVSDDTTPASNIVLHAESAVTSLIPDSGLVFSNDTNGAMLTLTPLPDQSGKTAIRVFARDAEDAETSFMFYVTVTATNQTPEITPIADQTILASHSTAPLSVNVADRETDFAGLRLTAASSNEALAPVTGIQLTGAGFQRFVTVTPRTGRAGVAIITITVTDGGGASSSTSFTLAVNPDPNQPTSAPPLAIQATTDGLVIAWPADGGDFVLEASSGLTNWQRVALEGAVKDGQSRVTVPVDQSMMFFRLRR